MSWVRLSWVELDWDELDWVELDRVELDRVELEIVLLCKSLSWGQIRLPPEIRCPRPCGSALKLMLTTTPSPQKIPPK